MAPRAAVRSILGLDPELMSYDLGTLRIFSSEAPDTVSRDKRWAVVRWLDATRVFGTVGLSLMEVWVYQPIELGRDYGVIDLALLRAKELLVEAEQVPGGDGWTLSGATWESQSADLTDTTLNALTKFSRFRVAGRAIAAP